MVGPLRTSDGRWPIESMIEPITASHVAWFGAEVHRAAKHDQAVESIRDMFAADGVDVTDRVQVLAAAAGATLVQLVAMNNGGDVERFVTTAIGYIGAILPPARPKPRWWRLVMDGRPTTLNAERKGNRWQRSSDVAVWRGGFTVLARQAKVPKLQRVSIEARPLFRTAASMQDVGACYPAVKAAIDGIRDAGVVPDDTPEHVIAITYRQPVVDRGRRVDALEVVITEEVA